MGALTKAADTVERRRKGPSCTAGAAVARMDDDDREQLPAWVAEILDDTHWRTWAWLGRVFEEAGHDIQTQTVRRHFKGECACHG